MKVCPLCAEYAPADAQFCKWCGIRVVDRLHSYRANPPQARSQTPMLLLSLALLGLVSASLLPFWLSAKRDVIGALFTPHASLAVSGTPGAKSARRMRRHSSASQR